MGDDLDTEVTSITKNRREDVRIALRRYRGKNLVDLRVMAQDAEGNRLFTAKGVSLGLEHLGELIDALKRAQGLLADKAWPPAGL